MSDSLDCALDLLRRLPPSKITQNINQICDMCPAIAQELLSCVDQPLKVAVCSKTGKDFLLCDYNRDGDSFRYLEG